MRKLYSLVLIAAGLLLCTNAGATGPLAMLNGSQTFESLQDAIDAAQSGDVINLIDNVTTSKPLWLGTIHENDAKKSLTLDLNGYSITSNADVLHTFVVSRGALKVLNSVPGQGGMYNTCAKDTSSAVFYLHGTWERGINPRTAPESDLFTFLSIEEGVNLYANGPQGSAIVVKEISDREATKPLGILYNTDVYWRSKTWTKGVANGVRVDVKGQIYAEKYGVKVDGNLRYPHPDAECNETNSQSHRAQYFPTLGAVQLADTAFVPYVHIYQSAVINQAEDNENGAAAYVSGYSHWLIEGTCNGATGMYVKSGEVMLNDAIITSLWVGDVHDVVGTTGKRGFESGGHSIVVESVTQYPGETVLIVEGDTKIKTDAIGGVAMLEIVTTLDKETKVDSIVIKGGTFTGGEEGYAMVISKETVEDPEADVIVYGTNVTGGVNIGGEGDIFDILAENTHTTVVNNSDGTATVVVSTGANAPKGVTSWAEVEEGDDVNWLGFVPVTIGADFTLGELQMIAGDIDHPQQLTVKEGKTFRVNKLIMNEYAQIVVESGSTFIVTGEQGINAPSVNNIVLKAEEGKSAYFLFNPAVTSNRHPNATVGFISKSYRVSATDLAWQRFGIPTYGALKSMTTQYEDANVATALASFNYAQDKWVTFGQIDAQGEAQGLDQMANPFNYYQMLHNTPNMGTVVTMTGELYGNDNATMLVRSNCWNGFANSYMAPIDGEQLIDMIPNTVDKAFYLYDLNAVQATWEPVTLLDIEDQGGIQPMQPFLVRNAKAAANVTIDYADAVYNPAISQLNGAPARRNAMNNITKAKLVVKGENCIDRVVVAEDARFTAEFDNGYEAVKYMNDGINMYVTADEKMAHFATDNLENTFIGFQTVKGGNYTIEFSNVQGEELMLIDHEANIHVAMVEGGAYEFTAAANATNDYRFEIVSKANMPTGIENTEAVKSVKGIYTITGQYMGEVNVWNSLPAGIYVVNGEKRVK